MTIKTNDTLVNMISIINMITMTIPSPLHRKIQIIRLLPMLHLTHLKMQPLPR